MFGNKKRERLESLTILGKKAKNFQLFGMIIQYFFTTINFVHTLYKQMRRLILKLLLWVIWKFELWRHNDLHILPKFDKITQDIYCC